MTIPTTASIDDIYGQMLTGRFGNQGVASSGSGKKKAKKLLISRIRLRS